MEEESWRVAPFLYELFRCTKLRSQAIDEGGGRGRGELSVSGRGRMIRSLLCNYCSCSDRKSICFNYTFRFLLAESKAYEIN